MLFLVIQTLLNNASALKSLTPKLEFKNYDRHAFKFQAEEFSMDWEKSWAAYYDSKADFHEFMTYLFENACTPPKQIAIEPFPREMLVCVKKCREGHVAVLKQTKSGKRKRVCKSSAQKVY